MYALFLYYNNHHHYYGMVENIPKYVYVFDFDGVIAYKGELYEYVIDTLKELYKHNAIICLASFNYRAMDILKKHDIANIFIAWRCGRSDTSHGVVHSLPDDHTDRLIINNKMLSKPQQISSMLYELDKKNKLPSFDPKIIYFDDSIENVLDALHSYDIDCWSIPVNFYIGIPKNLITTRSRSV